MILGMQQAQQSKLALCALLFQMSGFASKAQRMLRVACQLPHLAVPRILCLQVLPLVPPDEDYFSPYSGQDALCGHPLLISLEHLVELGLLEQGAQISCFYVCDIAAPLFRPYRPCPQIAAQAVTSLKSRCGACVQPKSAAVHMIVHRECCAKHLRGNMWRIGFQLLFVLSECQMQAHITAPSCSQRLRLQVTCQSHCRTLVKQTLSLQQS